MIHLIFFFLQMTKTAFQPTFSGRADRLLLKTPTLLPPALCDNLALTLSALFIMFGFVSTYFINRLLAETLHAQYSYLLGIPHKKKKVILVCTQLASSYSPYLRLTLKLTNRPLCSLLCSLEPRADSFTV